MIATGKKARKAHGTRAACKRAKSHAPRSKEFGHLAYSVIRGNSQQALAANQSLVERVRDLRRAKYGDPQSPLAV